MSEFSQLLMILIAEVEGPLPRFLKKISNLCCEPNVKIHTLSAFVSVGFTDRSQRAGENFMSCPISVFDHLHLLQQKIK